MQKTHLEEVADFIKQHRNNEGNFELIYAKLEEEAGAVDNSDYTSSLQEIKEKAAPEYKKAKEKGGTAWPEFEKFVSEFEKTVTAALKSNDES